MTPQSYQTVASDEVWIGEMFSSKNGESMKDTLYERKALENHQHDENAACDNHIKYSGIHGEEA